MAEVAVLTDSACYIPCEIRDRLAVAVIPLRIQVNGQSHAEPELDEDEFYGLIASGAAVSTSQPSPGDILAAYNRAADSGAREILSIHIGTSLSGTVQSARLAAESSPIPVTIIDTGQASFAEGLCVLEAAEAIANGASAAEAAALAMAASRSIGNTFIVRGLELAKRGGRLAAGQDTRVGGVPVMALTSEGMKVLGSASSIEEAVETMAGQIQSAVHASGGRRLRVGIGHGAASHIADALHERVAAIKGVNEIIRYTVGPAVGAHVGPGNAGAVFIARPVAPE